MKSVIFIFPGSSMLFSSVRTDIETAYAINYTQHNTVRRLLNHCFHLKSTKRSPCIVDLHVAVNNVQRRHGIAIMGSLCTVADLQNIPYCCLQNSLLNSSRKVPDNFCSILKK